MAGYLIIHTYHHQPWSVSTMHGVYTSSGSNFYCETIDKYPFSECLRHACHNVVYFTKGCFDGLTDSQKASVRSRTHGIVTKTGIPTADTIVECFSTECFKLSPDLACKGVVCDDVCINADKYSQVCATEGEDIGECVFDELIKENDPSCPGYVPPLPSEGVIQSIDVPAEASEGDGIDLCATIKNTGGTTAKFFLRFYDGSTMVRETSPGNVAAGQTITDICEYFTMPGHTWSGKIELMRQR